MEAGLGGCRRPVALSVSVAMATFNGEAYIREQLNSLAAQTMLPCELIIADDGSTDRTLNIAEGFALTAGFPVRIFRNPERLGFADNFLKAASLCEGALIAFCDQDDVWLASKIETCAKYFVDPELLLCVHSAKIWFGADQFGGRWPGFAGTRTYRPAALDPLAVYPGFAMVIRRGLLEITNNERRPENIHSLNITPHAMSHDQWFWFTATIFGKTATLKAPLSFYRQHQTNVYGAGPKRGFWARLGLVLKSMDYAALSRLDLECAALLEERSLDLREPLRSRATKAAALFRRRARLKALRGGIYRRDSALGSRLMAVFRIAMNGGYFSDGFNSRLGYRAGLKDLCYGVTGVYKLALAQS
jgi:glycosyltransferase involved in cell wall biosynthesis